MEGLLIKILLQRANKSEIADLVAKARASMKKPDSSSSAADTNVITATTARMDDMMEDTNLLSQPSTHSSMEVEMIA